MEAVVKSVCRILRFFLRCSGGYFPFLSKHFFKFSKQFSLFCLRDSRAEVFWQLPYSAS